MNMPTNTSDREIVTSRVLNAPRELVFNVWTHPDHVRHWYGPDGFTITTHEMDVRPGGCGVSPCMARTAATIQTETPFSKWRRLSGSCISV